MRRRRRWRWRGHFDLKLGDIVPLTGALADFGPPGRKSADLAVGEIKKAIQQVGVDRTVTIQHEDEETSRKRRCRRRARWPTPA